MSRPRAAAIVLAAGRGERLGGVAKAALCMADGRSFLEAIAQTARDAGVTPIVVAVAAPFAAEVRGLAERLGLAVVENPAPERGMASSLACGLAALTSLTSTEAGEDTLAVALAWPVDHPRVTAASLRALLDAAGPDRIVVPTHAGRGGHPTAFGRAFWPALLTAADAPEGARAVVRGAGAAVLRLALDDPGLVLDVDEPRDVARTRPGEPQSS